MEIPLTNPEQLDIYDYSFNKQLYRISEETASNPLIYNSITDAVDPSLISAGTISSAVNIQNLQIDNLTVDSLISIQGWQFSGTFSAYSATIVAWTAGTLTLSSGKTFSISAGSTGAMSALTYIYFSRNDSEIELQKTTKASDSVGANKILIAVGQNNTGSDATFQVFGGSGGALFKADNIASNSITANEIAANTITASEIATGTITANELAAGAVTATKINVTTLSSISADIGSITAGTITSTTVRTSAGNGRIELATDDTLKCYGTDGNLAINLKPSQIKYGTDVQFNFTGANIESYRHFVADQTDLNLGSSGQYWDDVNAKDFVDRGCLGSFDEGVELADGTYCLSDMEAIKSIQNHSTERTIYDTIKLDYTSFPKVCQKPAPLADKDIKNGRGEWKKGEKYGEDGIGLTPLISLILGALKELDSRLTKLEK